MGEAASQLAPADKRLVSLACLADLSPALASLIYSRPHVQRCKYTKRCSLLISGPGTLQGFPMPCLGCGGSWKRCPSGALCPIRCDPVVCKESPSSSSSLIATARSLNGPRWIGTSPLPFLRWPLSRRPCRPDPTHELGELGYLPSPQHLYSPLSSAWIAPLSGWRLPQPGVTQEIFASCSLQW